MLAKICKSFWKYESLFFRIARKCIIFYIFKSFI